MQRMLQMRGRIRSDERPAYDIIISMIVEAGGNGITQNKINLETSLDRTTVYRHTKIMEKDGKIKKITRGKNTVYIATDKALEDLSITATLISMKLTSTILRDKHDLILSDYSMTGTEGYFDFTSWKKYIITKFDPKSIEKSIFEISNRIGAYITYILIKSMDPKIIRTIEESHRNKRNLDSISRYQRVTDEWIRNAIRPTYQWLYCLIDVMRYHGHIPNPWTKENITKIDQLENNERKIAYKMAQMSEDLQDEETLDKIYHAFSEIYPHLNYLMEKIWKNLPSEMQYAKIDLESLENDLQTKQKIQRTCKHKFRRVRKIARGYLKKCHICGYEESSKSQFKRNLELTE